MDSTLDEEARTCAVIARNYGLIPYSLRDFWETIKPFCLGMESAGRSLNCWHHCDYGDQFKLQYFWDQLIKKLTYLAVANSWGELNGRPRAPSYPPPGAVPVSIIPGNVGTDQTTEVVDPHSVTVDQAVSMAKMEEEADVIEDIGLVRDINLANTVYTIPEVSLEYTATMRQKLTKLIRKLTAMSA
jgi:hypothetical protein